MAAALDDGARLARPEHAALPAGWHWLYFNPIEVRSRLGPDGHPLRGGFLPPVVLPRRMWAGSRLEWQRAFEVGREVTRDSRILQVQRKAGRSGEMVFVTIEHRYTDARGDILREEHDVVYREMPDASERAGLRALGEQARQGAPVAERAGIWRHLIVPDPVLLFRYSAATFNGHRIHYDADYAREVEGYPGLVVHGPLIATLILGWAEGELAAQLAPGRGVGAFSFRAKAPTFDISPFELHASAAPDGQGLRVWSTNNVGAVGLEGSLSWAAR
jgi:3-methylfumaryl-CoA hydratase